MTKVKITKPARTFKIARKHILATIERCLNGGGGPIEVDYGRYLISASGYRQQGVKGNSGVRVTWRTV